jgi:hypothetical protein
MLWNYVEIFLSLGGLQRDTLEVIADSISQERSRLPLDNVAVRALSGTEEIEFPAWMVINRATSRFVRLRQEHKSSVFTPGDIVVVDTSITDVRKLKGLVAAAFSTDDPFIGIVEQESDAGLDEPLIRFSLWLFDGEGDIPLIEFHGDPVTQERQYRKVLGRVIAWVPATGKGRIK